ncbi:MFS transporter [Massilia sp. W12]|uniref:MFS transporter n=1 Tax=Massilia sp. W12 TaxID=3126507 RepID=UPI0030D05C7E
MPEPAPANPPASPRFALLQICIIGVLGHLVLAGIRVTSTLNLLSQQVSGFGVGVLLSVFALAPTLLAMSAGRWLDRVGVQTPLRLAAAAMLCGSALAWRANGGVLLYCAALCVGGGFMIMHIASQNLVGLLSSESQRANRFAWLSMGFSSSSFGGPVLAGVLIDHAGHSAAYLLWMTLAALICLLSALPQARIPLHASHQRGGDSVLDLGWRNLRLRELFFIVILLASAWDIYVFMLPVIGHALHFSASTIGFILGVFAAGTFTIRLVMPVLTRRWREWQILLGALCIITLSFMLLPWLEHKLAFMAQGFVLGLALGAGQPNMLSLLHQAAPPGRVAEVIGIRVSIGNASQAMFPVMFGALSASIGGAPLFLVMGAGLASGLPLAWRRTRMAVEERALSRPELFR